MAAENLSLLFTLKARNEASKELKSLEAHIKQVKERIAEIRKETDVPFKTERIQALQKSLTDLKDRHKELKTSIADTQKAHQDLASAVGTLSPRLGALTNSLTGVVGPATAVAVGLAAIGAAAVGIFEITKNAAEFQGKLFDTSQQLGISVETLSALEIVAKTTGGSIEGITASLGIFQKKLEDALDPTSKEAALLKSLGIETNNTEEALRQSLTVLARMPEGFRQTATALELFGRGGKSLLAILKEMDGDLDGAMNKFRAMGILVSTEAAQAADKFNDQLALLGVQIRSVTAIVGNEAMPTILNAITSISKTFQDNQGTIVAWTHDIADAASGALVLANAVRAIGTQITGLNNLPVPGILQALGAVTGVGGIFQGLQRFGTPEIPAQAVPEVTAPKIELPILPSPGKLSGGGKAKAQQDEIYKAQLESSKEAAAKELETQRHLSESLKLAYEEQKVSLQQFFAGRQTLIDEHFNALIDAINREQQALDEARARGRIKTEEANKKDAELTQRTSEATNKLHEDTRRLAIEKQKALDKAELDLERQLAEIRAVQREGELNRIEDELDRNIITESEALGRRLAIYKEEHKDRMLLLEIESRQLSTTADKKIELDNQKIESEQRFTDETERLIQRRIEARDREAAATAPGATGFTGLGPDQIAALSGQAANQAAGAPPWMADTRDAFGSLGQAMSNVLGLGQEIGAFFGDTLSGMFSDLANAVGDAVSAFVLFGNAGVGLRKFTAELIAQIARMAAVQAVWELAQGLAMLALNFFWPDPKLTASAATHFKAAAVFGGLALIAAGAGRAVAGGAFNQENASASNGGGGGLSGSPPNPTQPRNIDIDRQRFGGNAQQSKDVIEIRFTGQLGDVIEAQWINRYNGGGRLRNVVLNDGRE